MTDFSKVNAAFLAAYKKEPSFVFESFGRLELLGNHTDHQGGSCLVATSSLSIQAAVSPCNRVCVQSEGYSSFSFELNDLGAKEEEKGTSLALTKGVLSYFNGHGYAIGGFEASLHSDIFEGAGLSSSAAYEVLVGKILSVLYNEDKADPVFLAKAGQYAENVYFGKPSGLLDQMGSALGGVSYLDFKDPSNPLYKRIEPSFEGYSIFLINPGLSHAHLSSLYAQIPADMKSAAFKTALKDRLIDVPYPLFLQKMETSSLTDSERRRALHFYMENTRVKRAFAYLYSENISAFLECERETEISQESLLRNTMIEGEYPLSPEEAVHRANSLPSLGIGSARVMGGGFAGTVLCFVPDGGKEAFRKSMAAFYGAANVVEGKISNRGPYGVKR